MVCSKIFVRIWLIIGLCGFITRGDTQATVKILKGTDASPGEFPYTVSLLSGNLHTCGGSIISSRHILTAAHCLYGLNLESFTVLTGATNQRTDGERHRILRVAIHPGYSPGSKNRWVHDIAVITLASNIRTSRYQAPTSLPKSRTPYNVIGMISGWGLKIKGGRPIETLQNRPVNIISNQECNTRTKVLDTHLCGYNGLGTGFCSGDSGGPLIYRNEVVGIVSFTVGCGLGVPDVYTRVDRYLDFIRASMY